MNDTMKYVVSATRTTPTWRNSEIVGGYDVKTIQRLKEQASGGLYVSGSGALVQAMIADRLVDELHLFVYPLTLSVGQRLFAEGMPPSTWTRENAELFDNGVIYLHLVPAR